MRKRKILQSLRLSLARCGMFCFIGGFGLFLKLILLPSVSLAAEDKFQVITVKDGDTLWGIAHYYLKDPNRWPEILKYNQLPLSDPMIALPGMKLKVPILLIKEYLRKASLIYVLNEVKSRRKGETIWERAKEGMDFYNEDGIRTMEKSRAHIRFFSGDILKMDENSMVILRPEQKVEEVNLLSGTLRASRTKLITPTAHVTPKSDGTVYKAKVREDWATIVQVEKGSAEVFGVDTGKKVIVTEGFANITLPKEDPSMPVRVPDLPEFDFPEFNLKGEIVFQNVPQPVSPPPGVPKKMELEYKEIPMELQPMNGEVDDEVRQLKDSSKAGKLKSVKNWKAYRLQIAKDKQFVQIVWDEKKELGSSGYLRDSKKIQLSDGYYYRRVSFFDEADHESDFFSISPLEIDTQPPKLTIFFPEEGYRTSEGLVNLEGQTEPGSFVTINNYPVPIKTDGKFSWSVVLINEGANLIKIVARDRFRNKIQLDRTVILLSK